MASSALNDLILKFCFLEYCHHLRSCKLGYFPAGGQKSQGIYRVNHSLSSVLRCILRRIVITLVHLCFVYIVLSFFFLFISFPFLSFLNLLLLNHSMFKCPLLALLAKLYASRGSCYVYFFERINKKK